MKKGIARTGVKLMIKLNIVVTFDFKSLKKNKMFLFSRSKT
jgi:hypothetical protein